MPNAAIYCSIRITKRDIVKLPGEDSRRAAPAGHPSVLVDQQSAALTPKLVGVPPKDVKREQCKKNVKLWYSADAQTGYPKDIPEGVRVAYMQTSDSEVPQGDLIFKVRKLRKLELPMAIPTCEKETPAGHDKGANCSSCQFCWR